ncbi:MAG TPA: hypothetical protein VM912_21010, partial [Terriglobales bacterium]|nr:hypothetical protein [Terriglobales bacterium]
MRSRILRMMAMLDALGQQALTHQLGLRLAADGGDASQRVGHLDRLRQADRPVGLGACHGD